jgi:hypothetical protein
MGFPRKYLNEGEEIILDVRPHWFYLAGPALALMAALVLAVWVSSATDSDYAIFPAMALEVSPCCGSSAATPSG